MKDLVINEKFKELIPPLSAEEFSQLEFNLIQDGCREPLVVWEGRDILIDGHNRYQICQANGIDFDTVELEFDNEREAEIWIIRNQFGRRNIPNFVRAELALKLKPKIAEKAKEKQVRKPAGSVPQNSAEQIDTRAELASIAGVSHDTINKVERILEYADDDTKKKLRSGEVSVNAAFKDATGKPHVANNSGNNEWYTPDEYILAAKKVMGTIDTDPASCDVANARVGAKNIYTIENSGIDNEWSGNVWMNPPYAQPWIAAFSDKVVAEYSEGRISQACVLVNNATDTAWFHTMAACCSAICFIRGRVRFLDPNGMPGAPLQGQVVIYIGENVGEFQSSFETFGEVLTHG